MERVRSLNNNWTFKEGFDPSYITGGILDGKQVNIPHTVRELPYDCFDQTLTCMVSSYQKDFTLQEIRGKRVLVSFEGVSAAYDLYVNTKSAGSHKGAYSMALFDITAYVHEGLNRLFLRVDSNEREDIPPNGSTVDYLIYGGIYRDVDLFIQGEIFLKQVLFRYRMEGEAAVLFPELLSYNGGTEKTLRVMVSLSKDGEEIFSYDRSVTIPEGEGCVCLGEERVGEVSRWYPENPVLYEACVTLLLPEGEPADTYRASIGFRTVKARADGFFLNDRKIKLIGMNRHQSFPYVGYAMGRRAQEKDAQLLRHFLGLNMVRCSHYMQSKYFLDACDQLGLMVFEEIPGWGYLGGEAFRETAVSDLRNMVLGHFNHPSIVMWGSRLNETADDDTFYGMTHQLCKELDGSRPTTGARWQTGSHLIEDIYSYNDYTPDMHGAPVLLSAAQATERVPPVPYLVSEHTGGVLPTRAWDCEERQEEFALRHAAALSRVLSSEQYLGALGWCMFDYNTHNDHNSLSKICSHGVFDMFRVPKWAAYFYASQKDPKEEIILVPCSMVGRGERCEPVPFWVLTNCDYIEVRLSHDQTRLYYPDPRFPGLKHPPIEVTQNGEFWQGRWYGAMITGFVGGRQAARCVWSDNPRLSKLRVKVDDEVLFNDCADETRIVCMFEDENGNRLYPIRGIIAVHVEGDITLIGPSMIPAMGGAAAFWVRTNATEREGKACVYICTEREELDTVQVEISLILRERMN